MTPGGRKNGPSLFVCPVCHLSPTHETTTEHPCPHCRNSLPPCELCGGVIHVGLECEV